MYLLVNVQPQSESDDLPFHVYMSDDEPSSDQMFRKVFVHVDSGVGMPVFFLQAAALILKSLCSSVRGGRGSCGTPAAGFGAFILFNAKFKSTFAFCCSFATAK